MEREHPQYLAQAMYGKSRAAPQYWRQKGPKMILEAWAPQYQRHDYTPDVLNLACTPCLLVLISV